MRLLLLCTITMVLVALSQAEQESDVSLQRTAREADALPETRRKKNKKENQRRKNRKNKGRNLKNKDQKRRPRGRKQRKQARQGIVIKGNNCEYIFLADITSNSGCTTGNKFVLKGATGVRKQFLILNSKTTLAFVTKGAKFTACTSFTDITTTVKCKEVADLASVNLGATGSAAATTAAAAATTAAAGATTAAAGATTAAAAATTAAAGATTVAPVNMTAAGATTAAAGATTATVGATTAAAGATTAAGITEAAVTTDAAATAAASSSAAAASTAGLGGTAAYCAIDSQHTMCLYTGASSECTAKTIVRGMSQAGKEAILARHNTLRRRVAKGEEANQPAASDMRELVWDDELETIAQRLADQCIFAHDSVRTKLDGSSVGQNLYIGGSTVQQDSAALNAGLATPAQAWYDEVTDPGFSSSNIDPFVFSGGAGHYTQVAWAKTHQVGCANVYYKDGQFYQNLVVCNYSVAGNLQGGTMYTQGTACSACPSDTSCTDSLCKAT